jgi:hypothetical protein
MFLMGQANVCDYIQGAWQGPVTLEGITHGELGIILTISSPGNWPGNWCDYTVSGTLMGLAIENGEWNEDTRHVTGQVTFPDDGSTLVFDCFLSLDETLLDCDATREGQSGEMNAAKVNDLPENPDPSTPLFDYARSYPQPGDTGVPLRPTFVLAWSKPMAPHWDINVDYESNPACGEFHGLYFTEAGYLVNEHTHQLQFKEAGDSLLPYCAYILRVQTCGDQFCDPFGVHAACPWPEVDFTTGGS